MQQQARLLILEPLIRVHRADENHETLKAINGEIETKETFVAALRQVSITSDSGGPMKMDELNNPIQNVYVRKVERVTGKLQNTVVPTCSGPTSRPSTSRRRPTTETPRRVRSASRARARRST